MKTKTSTVADLPGLGVKSAAMLSVVGIDTVEQFNQCDPFELYQRLKWKQPSTSLNFLYAIIGAQEGIHWQSIAKTRKTEIMLRLDDMGLAPK